LLESDLRLREEELEGFHISQRAQSAQTYRQNRRWTLNFSAIESM